MLQVRRVCLCVYLGPLSYTTISSGYIGGAILERLLQHHTASTSEITALVRNPDKVPLFASIGVKTVVGSHDDGALLERQASESDVVFACVSFSSMGWTRSVLTVADRPCGGLGRRRSCRGV